MEFGTVLAIAGLNLVIGGWIKIDQHRAENRADKKIDAFKGEIQGEMRLAREDMKEFRDEMKAFHREHAEMNKRILDLEMERKYGGKSC
jgi:hypothetical protein